MKTKGHVILPDVSLCAIVRDEKMNPAGGIERFVKSHVPFVEEAVIVDTGSLDGTREILEELQGKYSNLNIYDTKFNGFADARNYSLSKVKTKYALVLDADELITHEKPSNDWEIINNGLKLEKERYTMKTVWIIPNGLKSSQEEAHLGRLGIAKKMRYIHSLFENLVQENFSTKAYQLDFNINHFISSPEMVGKKEEEWYKQNLMDLRFGIVKRELFQNNIINKNIAPSQIPGFTEWKSYNSQRDFYK